MPATDLPKTAAPAHLVWKNVPACLVSHPCVPEAFMRKPVADLGTP